MSEQGASTPNTAKPCRLSRTPDGLVYTGETLVYRITGFTTYNLDRLRVTLKANLPDKQSDFHVDTIDLYSSRFRETYADACVKYLNVQQAPIMAELSQLIAALEAERISMREGGDENPRPVITEEEKKEALEALKNKDLIKNIISDFDAIGYIGEKANKLLGYIASVSRFQADPLALLIISRSGAGKTSLQDAVCMFVPPEDAIQFTRLTGQALFYQNKDALKNKVLTIEEEDGMREAMYSIKTLISSQRLSVSTTRTDPKTGKLSADKYEVCGPVVVFVSTTMASSIDDETKRRFLILTIDESEEQTKQILAARRTKNSPRWYQLTAPVSAVAKLHHNMQRLLKPLEVLIPDELKIVWPTNRLQYRGEHAKYFSLIKAIVLLFQYQRKTGWTKRIDGSKVECVYATQKDVDLALELGRDIFLRNVDDVPPSGRKILGLILKMTQEKITDLKKLDPNKELLLSEVPFTRKELRQYIGWSETQVRSTCELLVELGYLGKLSGRHGATFRYVLLDAGKDDPGMDLRENTTTTKSTQGV